MRRPCVVIDALQVGERPAGVARASLDLIRALAARDRGLDFTVAVTAPRMFEFLTDTPGWTVADCPGARGGVLRKTWYTMTELPRLCRSVGADLLHSLQFVAPVRPPCPLVVTVHDLAWQLFPGTVETPRLWFYRLLVPAVLRRAAAILASSEATAADLGRLHPVVFGKVVVATLGTPTWVWAQPGAGTAAGREAAGNARFLHVGTHEPRKNLEGLLDAYEDFLAAARNSGKVDASCPSLLLVGGRGWRDARLRRRLEELQERGRVEVRGYCGGDDLWNVYRSARGFVFPSLHEGFGLPLLEAMAAGLPVLTSGRGATAEVAGDAALLADPGSRGELAAALAELAWNEPLRNDLRERGFARARFWQWDHTADVTAAVYEDVLARGKPRPN